MDYSSRIKRISLRRIKNDGAGALSASQLFEILDIPVSDELLEYLITINRLAFCDTLRRKVP
jgi:hypothetical protein